MLKALLLSVLLFGGLVSLGQNKFLAYSVTGKVYYSLKGKKKSSLRIGKVIPETALVTVETGAKLVLVCEQASAPVTLSKGEYRLTSFRSSCDPQTQSATSNYLKYVWWQMTNPKGTTEEEKNRSRNSAGAVSRGCPGVEFNVPDTLNYYKEDILLSWKVFAPGSRAEFALYQDGASPIPLLVLSPRNEELHLDSLRNWLEPGHPYYWTILLDGNQVCERKLLQVWEQENFEEHVAELEKQLIVDVSEAERAYQMGFLLEQEGFFGEAYQYYRQAGKAAKDNERYKRTLDRFRKLYREED
jgi:hypothetical protein